MLKYLFNKTVFISAIVLLILRMPVSAQNECNYLVWSDEFDNEGAPNPEKWGYDIGGNGWGNNELQYYSASRNNSFVEDGKLFIKAEKPNNKWTSARLITKNQGDWLYGRIEVKAKLPSGKGTWPAIWMLPTDWEYGGWPKSGEIDIMEHVGYDMGNIVGTIHTEAYNHSIGTQKGKTIGVQNVDTEFHVYAIDWSAEEIIWYIDSVEYYREKNPNLSYKEWPFDKRFHLLLNIAIGGNWGGAQGIDPNLKEAVMEVDYVRVYQNKLQKPIINGKKNTNSGGELIFSTTDIPGVNYKWIFPDGVEVLQGIDSEQVSVIWGEQSGNVLLQVFSECDTVTSDSFFVDATATYTEDLAHVETNKTIVWPNPFQRKVNIRSNYSINKVELLNLTGQVVFKEGNLTGNIIRLSPFVSSGNYLLKTTFETGAVDYKSILKVN